MSFKVAFIDTNIFLHYRSFDHIDWLRELETEKIRIQIPFIIIEELDKHKYSSSAKLRDRASKVIKKLRAFLKLASPEFKAELAPNVEILFDVGNDSFEYDSYQLNPQSQDDRLLARIIAFRAINPNVPVVLVAADLGLQIKAQYHHINSTCLSDELKLASELDENEKRIKELEREILELKRSVPELKLCFANGTNKLNLNVKNPFPQNFDIDETILSLINEAKQKYPNIPESKPAIKKSNRFSMSASSMAQMYGGDEPEILPHEISGYNRQLSKFFEDYERFWREHFSWAKVYRKFYRLEISISNEGTRPAEDIDVYMHFPDGFSLNDLEALPRKSEEPKPPTIPVPRTRKERLDLQSFYLAKPSISQMQMPVQNQLKEMPNISSPNIRRSNSYDVDLHIGKLKQHSSESLGTFFIIFDSFENMKSFQIDYRVVAANVPSPVIGKLNVILDLEDNS